MRKENNNKIPPKITNGKIFSSCFYPKMGQPMFGVLKRETVQKILSLMVLLLFHYEPIPNQPGQMQMHKSPLLFLRLNNSVRISVQTNMVWLRTPSGPSAASFKVPARASTRGRVTGSSMLPAHEKSRASSSTPIPSIPRNSPLQSTLHFTCEKFTFYPVLV